MKCKTTHTHRRHTWWFYATQRLHQQKREQPPNDRPKSSIQPTTARKTQTNQHLIHCNYIRPFVILRVGYMFICTIIREHSNLSVNQINIIYSRMYLRMSNCNRDNYAAAGIWLMRCLLAGYKKKISQCWRTSCASMCVSNDMYLFG